MKKQIFFGLGLLSSFIGYSQNTNLGTDSGTTGVNNTFIGANAGGIFTSLTSGTPGRYNTFLGHSAGKNAFNFSGSVFLGYFSGGNTTPTSTGYQNNTCLGNYSGYNINGTGNIFVGYRAGYSETGSNKLYIDNQSTTAPFIFGDIASKQLTVGGISSIPHYSGTADVSTYKLFVKGGILTEAVRVSLQSDWADYVFTPDYRLMPLAEVDQFTKENGHLPNIPSAKEVTENGINVAEMDAKLLEKIEELTLYAIQQQKQIDELKAELKALKEQK